MYLDNSSHLIMRNVSFYGVGCPTSFSAVSLNNDSSARVENGYFKQNTAWAGSGFSIGQNCSLSFFGSTFEHNLAIGNGEAIYCDDDSKLLVKNSQFVGNTVSRQATRLCMYSQGGGVIKGESGVDVTVINCVFQNNSRTGDLCGGAVLNTGNDGSLVMTGSHFLFNKAVGGIFFTGWRNNLTVVKSTFKQNRFFFFTDEEELDDKNVILCGAHSHMTFVDSSFIENEGSILLGTQSSTVSLHHCVFKGNLAWKSIILLGENSTLFANNCVFLTNAWKTAASADPYYFCVICLLGRNSLAVLKTTVFSDNNATQRRNLIHSSLSSVTLNNCTLKYNFTEPLFSGIQSGFLLTGCTFNVKPVRVERLASEQHATLQNSLLIVEDCYFHGGVHFILSDNTEARFSNSYLSGLTGFMTESNSNIQIHKCTFERLFPLIKKSLGSYLKFSMYVGGNSKLNITSCKSGSEGDMTIWSETNSSVAISDSDLLFNSEMAFVPIFVEQTHFSSRNSVFRVPFCMYSGSKQPFQNFLYFLKSVVIVSNLTISRTAKLIFTNSNATLIGLHVHNTSLSNFSWFDDHKEKHMLCSHLRIWKYGLDSYLLIKNTTCATGKNCLFLNITQASHVILQNTSVQVGSPPQDISMYSGTLRLNNCTFIAKYQPDLIKWNLWPLHFHKFLTWNVTLSDGKNEVPSSDASFMATAGNMISNGTAASSDNSQTTPSEFQGTTAVSADTVSMVTPNVETLSEIARPDERESLPQHFDTPFAAGTRCDFFLLGQIFRTTKVVIILFGKIWHIHLTCHGESLFQLLFRAAIHVSVTLMLKPTKTSSIARTRLFQSFQSYPRWQIF